MKKEKWIEEILQTAKEIKTVAANPYLATRIEAKLQEDVPADKLPLRWVYAAAAVLLFLFIANISILRTSPQSRTRSSDIQQLIQDYDLGNNDLYSISFSNRQHE